MERVIGKARRSRGTADLILDTAERLVQTRGFNAFSYADVADAVGVRKASLHHHFATKADLGAALLARYRRRFGEALRSIEKRPGGAWAHLKRYVGLYASVLHRRRMCLCGMLAADFATLPAPMRSAVVSFFAENEAWLSRVLDAGRESGVLEFDGTSASMAGFLVSSLEGAMLLSRGNGGAERFDAVAHCLLASLTPSRTRHRAYARKKRTTPPTGG